MTRHVRAALVIFGAILMFFALPASAAVAPEAKPRPNLRVVSVTSPASARVDDFVVVKSKLSNSGPGDAGPLMLFFYLSTDVRLQSSDPLVNYRHVPALKAARSLTTSTRLPTRVRAGTWYVIVCADAQRRVAETNERDNCRVSPSIRLTEPQGPIRLVRNDEAARQRLRAASNLLYENASSEGIITVYRRIWITATTFRYDFVESHPTTGEVCRYTVVGSWALAEGHVWAENGGGVSAAVTIRPSDGSAPSREVLRFPNAEPNTMYVGDLKYQRSTSTRQQC